MKKNYIAPTSEHKMVIPHQMMAVSPLSIIDDNEGTNNAVSKGEGEDGDALVKGQTNVWENEW